MLNLLESLLLHGVGGVKHGTSHDRCGRMDERAGDVVQVARVQHYSASEYEEMCRCCLWLYLLGGLGLWNMNTLTKAVDSWKALLLLHCM